MKNLKRIALAGGVVATLGLAVAPAASAQSSQLAPAEQQQWQEDPLGAAALNGVAGSTELMQGTSSGTWSVASYYASLSPDAAYLGQMEKLDNCVKGAIGDNTNQQLRHSTAYGCLLADQDLKDAILKEVPAFH